MGFLAGTLLCGVAWSYESLLAGRIVAGLFGGVIGGVSMAIIADVFPFAVRGRVMGVVGTSFAAAQVLGIPIGLALANAWHWHGPFLLIVGVGSAVGLLILLVMKPIDAHLKAAPTAVDAAAGAGGSVTVPGLAPAPAGLAVVMKDAYGHLFGALTKPAHMRGFAATVLLATGGFMLMPYGSAFLVGNLHIPLTELPGIYVASGVAALFAGPLLGRLADTIGKYRLFVMASFATIVVVLFYTHLDGPTPLWVVIGVSIAMFAGVSGRMVTANALTSTVPAPADRGVFMAINSALQQVSGGVAAIIGGLLIVQRADGGLDHFDHIGFAVAGAALITLVPMGIIARSQPASSGPAVAPSH